MSAVLVAGLETAAIVSWALPLAVLLAVCLWWLVLLRRGAGR
jgi:hypothetical protein